MQSRVVISGVGLVTALGPNVQTTWQALLAGQCIRGHTRVHPDQAVSAGSRVAGLAIQAAHEALADARWHTSKLDADDTALVVATSKGPIDRWCPSSKPSSDNPALAGGQNFGLAQLTDELSAAIGLGRCRRLTVSAACASGLVALARAAMMVQCREVSRALVVAAEASVLPLFVASFRRLGVLADEGQLCRPFDQTRTGFLMSEAAAAICIERSDVYSPHERPPRQPRIAIDRFCLAAEATHLVAGDPTGQTLQHVLTQLTRQGTPDLIHAHGTGTRRADAIELAAIERVLSTTAPLTPPTLYSHKAALGHSLGAAGLVAAVINHQCHLHQCVPPNPNTLAPLPTTHATIPATPCNRPIHRTLTCAAGFGGTVAAVGFANL